jgi:hypothetical protein
MFRSKVVLFMFLLAFLTPSATGAREIARDGDATQVFVASGPAGDSFSWSVACHAGDRPPSDALMGSGNRKQNRWLGSLHLLSLPMTASTGNATVAGTSIEDGEPRRFEGFPGGNIQSIHYAASRTIVTLGSSPHEEAVLVVAPIGGTFETCEFSLDGEPVASRLLPEAIAGYRDLGGGENNLAWMQGSSGSVGLGTMERVELPGGPYLASCRAIGMRAIQVVAFGSSNIDPILATPLATSDCGAGGTGGQSAHRLEVVGLFEEQPDTPASMFHFVSLKGY